MKSRIALHSVLALILLGGGFLGWHVLNSDSTPTTSSSSLVTASKGNVLTTVSASGNVASQNQQSVSFATSGVVTSILVSVGQQVTAGQELATLDDSQTMAAIVTAKAALETAEVNLMQVQAGTGGVNGGGSGSSGGGGSAGGASAASSGGSNASSAGTGSSDQSSSGGSSKSSGSSASSGSSTTTTASTTTTSTTTTTTTVPPTEAQSDTAYAKLLSARADVVTALQNESDTILRAPTAGTVAVINGTVGQTVSGTGSSTSSSSSAASSAGSGSGSGGSGFGGSSTSASSSSSSSTSGFMTLVDLNNYEVQVPFTEADSVGVKVGAAATLSVSAINQSFTGHVTSVALIGTTSSNVVDFETTVTFDPGQNVSEVKPGMTTQVSIVTQTADDVVTLPTADVTATGTRTTLNVVGADGKAQARLVSIGLRGDDTVEISSGLSAGEKVKITRTSSASTAATGFGGLGGGLGGGGGFGGLGGGAFRRLGAGGGGTGGTGGGGGGTGGGG